MHYWNRRTSESVRWKLEHYWCLFHLWWTNGLLQIHSPPVDTVQRLAEILRKERVVHIRDTPASGKSYLAWHLRDYYLDQVPPRRAGLGEVLSRTLNSC